MGMARAPLRFRETDLLRAMRAAKKDGGSWGVDVLVDGTIRLIPTAPTKIAEPSNGEVQQAKKNPWD